MKQIYLDYAAATPIDRQVAAAMRPYLSDKFYNPSAMYLAAQDVRRDLEAARHDIAKILGAQPAEIIFTSGATEANNLALHGVMNRTKDELIVSAIEHESVLAPAQILKAKIAPVDKYGQIKLDNLKQLINDRTRLISVIMVSNEIGALQPIAKIAQLVKAVKADRLARGIKQPIYLHSDAAQAANYLDLNVARLGIDLLTINGAKLYGPKQTGVLYIKAGTQLSPQILGGGQEFGLRAGTENVAGAIGLATALKLAGNIRRSEADRLTKLRETFLAKLAANIPSVKLNGSQSRMAPHIVNILLPGYDAERLMMELDERGIIAAVGSACSAADDEPSHVLQAIGLSSAEARSCLRFSFGRQTNNAQINTVVNEISHLVKAQA